MSEICNLLDDRFTWPGESTQTLVYYGGGKRIGSERTDKQVISKET